MKKLLSILFISVLIVSGCSTKDDETGQSIVEQMSTDVSDKIRDFKYEQHTTDDYGDVIHKDSFSSIRGEVTRDYTFNDSELKTQEIEYVYDVNVSEVKDTKVISSEGFDEVPEYIIDGIMNEVAGDSEDLYENYNEDFDVALDLYDDVTNGKTDGEISSDDDYYYLEAKKDNTTYKYSVKKDSTEFKIETEDSTSVYTFRD